MRFADAVRASVLLRKQEQRATVDELLGSELDETLGPERRLDFLQMSITCSTPRDEHPFASEFCIATYTGEFVDAMTGLEHCMKDCKHRLDTGQVKQKKRICGLVNWKKMTGVHNNQTCNYFPHMNT